MTWGTRATPRNRHDIAHEIEIELVVERRADGWRCIDHQKGVAVRFRARNSLSPNISTCARLVLDDKLLPEPLRQGVSNEAGKDVSRTACGKRHNHAHRP